MSDPVFGSQNKGSLRDSLPLSGQAPRRPVAPEEGKTLNLTQPTRTISSDQGNMGGPTDGMTSRKSGMAKNKKWFKVGAAVILVFVVLAIITAIFHSATITIKPKETTAAIVQTFAASSSSSEGAAPFTRIEDIAGEEVLFIEGTVEENIQTRASGTILIKNNTNLSQRFIATTRFESQDGKIYRTPRSIQIPANGSLEVEVSADQPGEDYNIESGATFTLPGLKGTPTYEKFTGSQVGPFTGGYSGIIKTATDEEIDAAKVLLSADLEKKLRDELVTKIPEGYIVTDAFIDLTNIEYTQSPNELRGGVNIVAKASIAAITFKKNDFDAFIASQILPDYIAGQAIQILNVDELELKVVTDDFSVAASENFEFSLKGDAQFQWSFDEAKVLAAVAGKQASFIEKGLIEELKPMAKEIEVSVTPFWSGSVPTNPDRIKINIINE